MKAIHRDEIHHVAFGLEWLKRLKPDDQTDWDAYASHCTGLYVPRNRLVTYSTPARGWRRA